MTIQDKPLGFWTCTALIVGNVIGMGIFMLPASLAPFGWNAFLGWAVTLIGAVFIALTFAHLARVFPSEDGPYAYMRLAFGDTTAFFVIWCYWVSIWITNATLAISVVGYLTSLFPVLAKELWYAPAAALFFIWFFVAIGMRGARTSGGVQMLTTVLKLMPLLAVIVLGVYVLFADPHAYVAHLPTSGLSLSATTAAGTIAMFAMLGVESATIPAGKVDRPEINIPRATMVGTLVAAVIYIGVSAVPLLLLPAEALAKSNAPFVDLLNRYMNADSAAWIALFVIVSGLGALNGWTLLVGEMTASLAHHQVFPAVFKKQNRYGAPVASLLLTGVLASAMILMNYSRSLAQGFTFLSVMVTASNLPLYVFGALAIFVLWRRAKANQGSSVPKWLLVAAALSLLFNAWIAIGIGAEPMLWIVVLGLSSLPIYFFMRWWRKTRPL
ncbi:amino acid permease [Undibacterium sp.]|uniref:amino acid permease n=1 Tax=Undibacterium sp. TaxID=1914977 RepID=UPI00375175DA